MANSAFSYKYNGKELQSETGMIDYGWRQYMPEIGRWNGMDQLAEMYVSTSTYSYVANNPVMRFDVDGRWFNDDGTIDTSGRTPNYVSGKQYRDSFLGVNRNDGSGSGGGSSWGQSFSSNSEPTVGDLIDAWLNKITTDEILSIISSGVNNLLNDDDSENLFDGTDLTQYINKDIIILNASEGAGGKGHSGLIIGNDKDGYTYIASDGRVDSSGSTWMGGKNDASVKVFKTRKEALDFAKTRYNYDDSITIKTTPKQDLDAAVRAMQQLQSNYHFIFNNCNHIISAALVGAGLSKYGGYSVIPNVNFKEIKNNLKKK